ncbi:MAG: NTP transferase domain-containing protein, partial [Pseudomonadota bacterium]
MTGKLKPKLGAILLAAGGSSRLGRPKQLLRFGGETLLRRAARTLTETEYFPIVVVLGAEPDSSFEEIKGLAVHAVINPSWAQGMSSSIRKGLETVIE